MLLEAIQDRRLAGDCLLFPIRVSVKNLQNTFQVLSPGTSLAQRVASIFQKACLTVVWVTATTLSALPAVIGICIKWLDLARRLNELLYKGPAVTYSFPWYYEARLGDKLVGYLHAKHLAEQLDIPLYFRPFKGANYFALSQREKLVENPEAPLYFRRVVHLTGPLTHFPTVQDSVLYVLPYYPDSPVETRMPGYKGVKRDMNWTAFKPQVAQLLQVIQPYQSIDIPEGAFSIAIHIRTGGDFDACDESTKLPTKLPTKNYYAGELERLLNSPHAPEKGAIFIHIFTDDLHPDQVHEWLYQEMVKKNLFKEGRQITLSFTKKPTLIDDIANMPRFQAMIRPDSNLSAMMSRSSTCLNYEVYPVHYQINPEWTRITIDRVERSIKGEGVEVCTTSYQMPVYTRPGVPLSFYQLWHRCIIGTSDQYNRDN